MVDTTSVDTAWVDKTRFLIADIECPPYFFVLSCATCTRAQDKKIHFCRDIDHFWVLQACLERTDTFTGESGVGYSRKYLLSPHMTEGEIVRTALVAALAYAEHEVREHFTYKGRALYGPHMNTEKLLDVASDHEVRT